MRISGLQKMGLLDYPGKVACTVFTGGCNLRCPFCHNSELLANPPALMETDELLAFLDKRRGLLDGDRKSTRLNSSHTDSSRMPSSA